MAEYSKSTQKEEKLKDRQKPLENPFGLQKPLESRGGTDPSFNPTPTPSSITLVRQAFDKEKFNETVNTEFTELGVVDPDLGFFDPNLATVGDFFTVYNNLFFLIPKTGPNSHTTLIEQSSEYVEYQANQAEIQALLDEIAEVREQTLQLTIDVGNVLGAQEEIQQAIDAERQAASNTEN